MPITLKNVDFDFSFSRFSLRRKILKDINLNIPHGVVIALIGATGSGKSTLISLFNGLLLPASGKVMVNHYSFYKEISSQRLKQIIKAVRREVNISFQFPEYQLFEDTVEKDIIFGPKNLIKKKYGSFLTLIQKTKVSF
jgi:energy-coupling factor transport system ATP-binding protein